EVNVLLLLAQQPHFVPSGRNPGFIAPFFQFSAKYRRVVVVHNEIGNVTHQCTPRHRDEKPHKEPHAHLVELVGAIQIDEKQHCDSKTQENKLIGLDFPGIEVVILGLIITYCGDPDLVQNIEGYPGHKHDHRTHPHCIVPEL